MIYRIFIVDKCTTIFQLCTKIYKKVKYLTILTILQSKYVVIILLHIILCRFDFLLGFTQAWITKKEE